MGRYREYLKTLPANSSDIGSRHIFEGARVVKPVALRKKFTSWNQENKSFYDGLAEKHLDSVPFLASVRNSVGKQSYWKSRPKSISKSLAGEVVGRQSVSHETRRSLAYADANRALLEVDETLVIGDLKLSWDDQSLCYWARAKADLCDRILVDDFALHVVKKLVHDYGFRWPVKGLDLFGDTGAAVRVRDERWWRRQARVAKFRAMDQLARAFRMVHVKAQVYCSNQAVALRRAQARRNRSMLEGMEAINNEGDAYTLAELSDLSVSNPVNRRNELMVRMKGFELIADRFGHEGLFITISCPSRFHPMKQIKNTRGRLLRVDENKNYGALDYERYNPRQAQEWMTKTWSLIRSAFDRQGIRCYGFRVVEPNHDGTPHWHQLLFFKKYDLRAAELIFKRYVLRTDTFEKGAGNRLKIVTIDKSRGSATGYIAKYICKNIDGSHIDNDLFGYEAVDMAERICAWASGWGIRQFQQIGGPSVTVWRELRRMDVAEGVVEEARLAADASDWAAYCMVQGDGMPFFGRDDQVIRPAYWNEYTVDEVTGEVEYLDELKNSYGEDSRGRLFGVCVGGVEFFMSRFYRWTIDRMGKAVKAIQKALPVSVLSDDELLDLLRGDGAAATA